MTVLRRNGRLVVMTEEVAEIIDTAAERHGLTRDHLLSRQRWQPIPTARAQAWAEMRDRLGWSTSAIGALFGRDHSTVSHALRNMPVEAA